MKIKEMYKSIKRDYWNISQSKSQYTGYLFLFPEYNRQTRAELCGESYAPNNSHNLISCQELNRSGWQWKVIYFALIDYFGRMDMEWKQKADNGELAERDFLCGQWFIGDTQEHLNVLYDCLKTVNAKPDKYKTAEEFFFEWDKENFIR